MPDFRLSDDVMMSEGLMDIPMFSVPMPFTMAAQLALALKSVDMHQFNPDMAETVHLMYAMLLEHALNNYPQNLELFNSF